METDWWFAILDEFNRACSGTPASGYVAPAHIATAANSRDATTWNPPGYRATYRKIWGRWPRDASPSSLPQRALHDPLAGGDLAGANPRHAPTSAPPRPVPGRGRGR
jgi:hypothetical protein